MFHAGCYMGSDTTSPDVKAAALEAIRLSNKEGGKLKKLGLVGPIKLVSIVSASTQVCMLGLL